MIVPAFEGRAKKECGEGPAVAGRSQRCSTALVTNIDFEAWADYLGDAPLAMPMLDRVVDGATIVTLQGKSYRAHRGGEDPTDQ